MEAVLETTARAHVDAERLMELREECPSVSGGTQTDGGSTVCLDYTDEPVKHADSGAVRKSLNRAESHDPVKAGKGVEEITWYSLEPTNRRTIGGEDGVAVLLRAAQRWMGKRSGIVEGCLLGLSRVMTCEENIDSFYEYENDLIAKLGEETGYNGGGSLILIAAMSGYPLKVDLQRYGCRIAAILAGSELYTKRFHDQGIVGQVLHALQTHPDSAVMVVEGLQCLLTLMKGDEGVRWLVSDGVVLDYFAEAVKFHLENTEVAWVVARGVLRAGKVDPTELRKTMLIPKMLDVLECHARNYDLVTCVLLGIIPHLSHYPSRIDEAAVRLKKIMSLHCTAPFLTLCCVAAHRLASASPDDVTTLRLSRHLVPYLSSALSAFSSTQDDVEGADQLISTAQSALSALVVSKWDTTLGRPKRRHRVLNVKHKTFVTLIEAAASGDIQLKVDWARLANGV